MALGKEVFVALAAIAWADGRVHPAEVATLLAAAQANGIEGPDLEAVRAATETRVDLSAVEALSLPYEAREIVYAFACWLTRADRRVTDSEVQALDRVAHALKLSPHDAARAELASRAMATLTDDTCDLAVVAKEIERRVTAH